MAELLKNTIANEDILNLIKVRRQNYLNDPLEIVAHYNSEIKNIDEYNGRQLLEMIQNANDECDTGKDKKALIKLDEQRLIIANNGNPFSKGGVESLMYSDLSPKKMEENKVGQKGLGFRSVLNWAKEIAIDSYDLHIRFSKEYAIKFLQEIIEEKPSVLEVIKSKTSIQYPISVLRCPYLVSDKLDKAEPEYDTVIELILNEAIEEEIALQIENEITPEVLLFLHKLEELEVITNDKHFVVKKLVEGAKVLIEWTDLKNNANSYTKIWNILEEKGELIGAKERKNYEIKIAYNPENEIQNKKLYSYFRTDIDFPYPVVAHGTFELKSSRDQLAHDENGFNKMLLEKLALLIISGALNLTKDKNSSYEPLIMVLPKEGQYSGLDNEFWNFGKVIYSQLKNIQIFPTIHNRYISLNDNPVFYNFETEKYIPKDRLNEWSSLLRFTSNNIIKNYFAGLEYDFKLDDNLFNKKVESFNDSSDFPVAKRAFWIYLLCKFKMSYFHSQSSILPDLLLNPFNKVIKNSDEVVLPPEGAGYVLPDLISLKFIEKNLYETLKARFKGAGSRQMVENLKEYQVIEYSFFLVAQKLVTGIHKLIEEGLLPIRELIFKLHNCLFVIYSKLPDNTETKKNFPSTIPSPYLYNRNENLKPAKELYFGEEFESGSLMEGLLGNRRPDLMLADLTINGFRAKVTNNEDSQTVMLENYFSWLGITHLPRRDTKKITGQLLDNNEFIKLCFENLKFPYKVYNYNDMLNSIEDLNNCWGFSCEVLWYEYFDEIISHSTIEYILAWFLIDISLHNAITTDSEINTLHFAMPSMRNYREIKKIDVKSYLKYILSKTDFIPSSNGKKVKPSQCLTDIANLSPLIDTPILNYEAEIFKDNRIAKDQINHLIRKLGVKDSFEDLSISQLYFYLNQHHEHFETNRKNAYTFYTAIIEATKNKTIEPGDTERLSYLKNGFILAEYEGKEGFYKIADVTYVDNPNFSQELLQKLKVARLPSRAGNIRMANLFGVQPLDYIKFSVKDDVIVNHKLNENFVNELNDLKPHLYAFRFTKAIKQSQLDSELSVLKNLKIQTCYEVNVSYIQNDKNQSLNLADYEYIQDEKSSIYFIKINKGINNYHNLKSDFRFKETLADIICGSLKVTENRKDFILLLGESSNSWFKLLNREFNEYSETEKSINKLFDGALSQEEKFWKIICDIKCLQYNVSDLTSPNKIYEILKVDLNHDEFFNLCRAIDYKDLSKFDNFKPLTTIFKAIDIDLADFNALGNLIINFEDLWKNRMYTYHKEFSKRYASFLFKQNQSEKFKENWEQFSELNSFSINNTLFFDYKENHKLSVHEYYQEIDYLLVLNTEIIDLESIYKANLNNLEKKLRDHVNFDSKLFQDKKYEADFVNAVYFNRVENIVNELYLAFDAHKKKGTESTVIIGANSVVYGKNDVTDLLKAIEARVQEMDYTFEIYSPAKIADSTPFVSDEPKKRMQSFNGKSKDYSIEDIGFIGEKYAFEILKKEFDHVNWVSEYALKAGFSNGKDGLGYDFECLKGNVTRFVEVKSTVTSNYAFQISKTEVKIGHSKEKVFDILLITNLLSSDIGFKYLKNIFEFQNNESFLENSKFLVENDSYKIKFR
jgi:hypothetical protein